ncbi:MAG: hypothetical protein C5B51_09530 [Terriglobia bacterium]|nr:MAG: hypothetical protein C5B51_09530 [Terriglobia bacterium]
MTGRFWIMKSTQRNSLISMLIALAPIASAQVSPTETVLYHLGASATDALQPQSTLTRDAGGNFYGVAPAGGAYGKGAVFMVTPSGAYTTLYSFCSISPSCSDGSLPYASLLLDHDGNFWGTTVEGGASYSGTIFKITPSGVLTTVHSFDSTASFPQGGLIFGPDGSLYGTTTEGAPDAIGTIYKITPGGAYTQLFAFKKSRNSMPQGANPLGLVLGPDGNFYGVTEYGGQFGFGVIFRFSPSGVFAVLQSMGTRNRTGAYPLSAPAVGPDGALYGTTNAAGQFNGGTAYRLTTSGVFTVIHNFGSVDGFTPNAGLLLDTDGNFCSTTVQGGSTNRGTVYQMTPAGAVNVIYSFGPSPDGSGPVGGLAKGLDGSFYGTTSIGGLFGNGVIFKLTHP